MFKKLLFTFIVIGMTSISFGKSSGRGYEIKGNVGPANNSANAIVTVAAAGSGNENCLTSLTANATSAYILRVLDGLTSATTVYQLQGVADTPLLQLWGIDGALCGSSNVVMQIKVTGTDDKGHTAQKNYQGFIK